MYLTLFRIFASLYPTDLRLEYGTEMELLLSNRLGEATGSVQRSRILALAIIDLIRDSTAARFSRDPRGRYHHIHSNRARTMIENLLQDLRFSLRSLSKTPGFTAIAVTTLALGIGANTAIFSVVRSVLLRPLPYANQDRIVSIWNARDDTDLSTYSKPTWLSEPELLDYRAAEALQEVAVYDYGDAIITGEQSPERVTAGVLEAGVLRILGVQPELGRWFDDEENLPGGNTSVILGHSIWENRLGADRSILGQSLIVNGRPRTIVGVMPASFRLPTDFADENKAQLFIPIELDRADPAGRGSHYLYGIGLLAEGASVDQASAQLESITQRLTDEGHYNPERGFRAFAMPIRRQIVGDVEPAMLILLGAVGFVLLIACTNVANLLLARTQARSREFALRNALGASGGRIAAQQLVESVVLATFGGLLGMLVSIGGLNSIAALNPQSIPRFNAVGVDGVVLGFTLVVSLLTGLLFGIVPAINAVKPDLVASLKEGTRGAGASRGADRLRKSLVISQVAFAVLLTTGGALMARSFWKLMSTDAGFRTERVMTMQLYLPSNDYQTGEQITRFYRQLLDRLRATPGMENVGLARNIPLNEEIGTWTITAEDVTPPPSGNFSGEWQVISAGYAEAMGVGLRSGRFFEDFDTEGQTPVAMVNARLAEAIWPDEEAVGKRFRLGGQDSERRLLTIVGVVENVRHNDLTKSAEPKFYVPFEQWTGNSGSSARRGMHVVAKAQTNPLALVGAVRSEVNALDSNLPLSQVQTYDDIRSRVMSESRLVMALLAGFAGLALLIAAIGVYGVISYSVVQRIPEIGVRLALGASAPAMLRMVIGQGLAVVAAGIVLGSVAAAALGRTLTSMLYQVEPLDPVTFSVVPLLLLLVAIVASVVPAVRAAGVDPMEALRYE